MITCKNYVKAESLAQAWELNQKRSNLLIGGMHWVKMGRRNVQTIIDLSALGLDQIKETEEEFRIGCMVTLRQMELHEGLNRYSQGAVRESLRHIVGVQFRNGATVGGSVFGRFGFSDVLTMLLAMDTQVELYQGGVLPLAEFIKKKRDRDILVSVIVKKTQGTFAYQSMRVAKTDFPVLAVAVSRINGQAVACVGARPAIASRIEDQEGILKGEIGRKEAEAFGKYVAERTLTGSNMRGSAQYRTHLAEVLTRRAVLSLE